jgi:uncharacterized protein YutE (UPF0331/DUF86 family)
MRRELIERKLAHLHGYIRDIEAYVPLSPDERLRQHYAIERLLQLLCEVAADITLQLLKSRGVPPPESYRAVFEQARDRGWLPQDLAQALVSACGLRNVIVHLYDTLDMARVLAAVDAAPTLYRRFARWALENLAP